MECLYLNTRPLLWLILAVVAFVYVTPAQCTAPNIVFILADDLGWNDVGYHNPDIITPNIDNLARTGVILNQSYVQPVCTPSRAALMTGVYPFRLGLQHMVILPNQAVCVPKERPFLSEIFKKSGYATHAVGKWHLGFCNKSCTPTYRGFDSFLGYYNGMEDYYNKDVDGGFDFRDNEYADQSYAGDYSVYQYRDRIRKILDSHNADKPLFLYLPYQSVHTPLQVPQKYLDMYPNITDKDRRTHSAMVTALDDAIGDLVKALKTKGIYDNTLIVFSADNGGMVATGGNNYPLRGSKVTVFEGGTRAAGFVHGPMLPITGVKYDGLIHAVDWFPTLLEAAGIKNNVTDQDGVSQWGPLVRQISPSNRQEVVYNIDDSEVPEQGKAAIRIGDYKLIDGFPGFFPGWYKPAQYHDKWGPLSSRYEESLDHGIAFHLDNVKLLDVDRFLFNLKDDPNEHVNLYDSHPDIVKQLRSRLEQHRKKYVTPNYPSDDPRANPKNWGGVWTSGWC